MVMGWGEKISDVHENGKLLIQDTTQKLWLPCLCPLPSHPDEITSLKPPTSPPKPLSEADKWHHLPFTQAEGQRKQTDLNMFCDLKWVYLLLVVMF